MSNHTRFPCSFAFVLGGLAAEVNFLCSEIHKSEGQQFKVALRCILTNASTRSPNKMGHICHPLPESSHPPQSTPSPSGNRGPDFLDDRFIFFSVLELRINGARQYELWVLSLIGRLLNFSRLWGDQSMGRSFVRPSCSLPREYATVFRIRSLGDSSLSRL